MVEDEDRRSVFTQPGHDMVIMASAKIYGNSDRYYSVYVNPKNEKNVSVKDKYPDVIVYETAKDEIEKKPTIIEEVETVDTTDEYECKNQWVSYTKLNVQRFNLIVPLEVIPVAENELMNSGITDFVMLKSYEIRGDRVFFRDR